MSSARELALVVLDSTPVIQCGMEIWSPYVSLFFSLSLFFCFSFTKLRPGGRVMVKESEGDKKERNRVRKRKKKRSREECGISEVHKVTCVYSCDATSASDYRASVLFFIVVWHDLTFVQILFLLNIFTISYMFTQSIERSFRLPTVQCWDSAAGNDVNEHINNASDDHQHLHPHVWAQTSDILYTQSGIFSLSLLPLSASLRRILMSAASFYAFIYVVIYQESTTCHPSIHTLGTKTKKHGVVRIRTRTWLLTGFNKVLQWTSAGHGRQLFSFYSVQPKIFFFLNSSLVFNLFGSVLVFTTSCVNPLLSHCLRQHLKLVLTWDEISGGWGQKFLLWEPWKSTSCIMLIHPMLVKMFQPGPKQWTKKQIDWHYIRSF